MDLGRYRDSRRRDVRQRAFTLVEIMIAVAIISLLAVLSGPTYRLIRNEVRKATCKSGQRLIRDSVDQWAATSSITNGALVNPITIRGYIKGKTIPACPENNKQIAIPLKVGDPVECPSGIATHTIPND